MAEEPRQLPRQIRGPVGKSCPTVSCHTMDALLGRGVLLRLDKIDVV